MKGVEVDRNYDNFNDKRGIYHVWFRGDALNDGWINGYQIQTLTILPGVKNPRGNHFHTNKRVKDVVYCVQGKAIFIFEDISTKKRAFALVKPYTRVIINANIAHSFYNISDTKTFMFVTLKNWVMDKAPKQYTEKYVIKTNFNELLEAEDVLKKKNKLLIYEEEIQNAE